MSGKGNCYDNAAMETFFKTINAELIWCTHGIGVVLRNWPTLNTSTVFTTLAGNTRL